MPRVVFASNPSTFHWRSPDGSHSGSFRPNGKIQLVNPDGYHQNPEQWSSTDTISARLFVGFNVGGKPTWKLQDLIDIVQRVRVEQGERPDSSFLSQTGIYTSDIDGSTVREEGAQVIIFAPGTPMKTFSSQMTDLAESIGREMDQEVVIVDLQKNGISQLTKGVTPT